MDLGVRAVPPDPVVWTVVVVELQMRRWRRPDPLPGVAGGRVAARLARVLVWVRCSGIVDLAFADSQVSLADLRDTCMLKLLLKGAPSQQTELRHASVPTTFE
ncbi:unnamed protein product [Urochloa humidicola]